MKTVFILLVAILALGHALTADQYVGRFAGVLNDDARKFESKYNPAATNRAGVFKFEGVQQGGFKVMNENNGNAYGQVGRDYVIRRAKALNDVATVRKLYDVPVYVDPSVDSGCEIYAYGAPVPSSVMRFKSFGRIHPVGSFTDSEKSKEYFLLACPLLDGRPLQNQVRVFRTSFKHVSAWRDELDGLDYVWAEILLELSVPEPAPGAPSLFFNHTHLGFFLMDENSTICGYKIFFQRLELRDPAPETQTDAVLNTRIANLCNNVVNLCANTTDYIPDEDRYASVADCIAFNSVPARKSRNGYQWVDQDSLRCREFHLGLIGQSIARNQPDHQAAHCTHSGPRGGGKCVTHSFASFFEEKVTCQA